MFYLRSLHEIHVVVVVVVVASTGSTASAHTQEGSRPELRLVAWIELLDDDDDTPCTVKKKKPLPNFHSGKKKREKN